MGEEGDPAGEVAAALLGKELLRDVYASKDEHQARRRLVAFYQHAVDAGVSELLRLARTVDTWETEIMTFFTTRVSNGATEAQNLVTEKIRRIGHGFRNLENYRLRLLLHSGVKWEARPVTRIRGRQSRTQLVA